MLKRGRKCSGWVLASGIPPPASALFVGNQHLLPGMAKVLPCLLLTAARVQQDLAFPPWEDVEVLQSITVLSPAAAQLGWGLRLCQGVWHQQPEGWGSQGQAQGMVRGSCMLHPWVLPGTALHHLHPRPSTHWAGAEPRAAAWQLFNPRVPAPHKTLEKTFLQPGTRSLLLQDVLGTGAVSPAFTSPRAPAAQPSPAPAHRHTSLCTPSHYPTAPPFPSYPLFPHPRPLHLLLLLVGKVKKNILMIIRKS